MSTFLDCKPELIYFAMVIVKISVSEKCQSMKSFRHKLVKID